MYQIAFGQCEAIKISKKIEIKETLNPVLTNFNIISDGKDIGDVNEALISLTTKYTWKDNNGNTVATAQKN